ncbi:hypothetical protein MLD38_005584 [Melastoma candidum]|uniref:Uncharacterized protein n=1 Tax=Melastoma candidum TaxID=119954 RepID=A0ACB9RNT2_9MYRT|nr:hypothetical protein MLD38_005584 [Melastoma candidum]
MPLAAAFPPLPLPIPALLRRQNWRNPNTTRPFAAAPDRPLAEPMEVEIKLRLPDAAAHRSLAALLSPHHLKTLHQENLFFDSPQSQLSRNLSALRVRFSGPSPSAVLSLKSKPSISSGISRVEETEEPLEESFARSCLSDPGQLLSIGKEDDGGHVRSEIMRRVREEFRVNELVCLGGFRNVRGVYEWKGLKLELDETEYSFGTTYELECESGEPERDREVIEGLLRENGVSYSYSEVNKFAVFMSRKLP